MRPLSIEITILDTRSSSIPLPRRNPTQYRVRLFFLYPNSDLTDIVRWAPWPLQLPGSLHANLIYRPRKSPFPATSHHGAQFGKGAVDALSISSRPSRRVRTLAQLIATPTESTQHSQYNPALRKMARSDPERSVAESDQNPRREPVRFSG